MSEALHEPDAPPGAIKVSDGNAGTAWEPQPGAKGNGAEPPKPPAATQAPADGEMSARLSAVEWNVVFAGLQELEDNPRLSLRALAGMTVPPVARKLAQQLRARHVNEEDARDA